MIPVAVKLMEMNQNVFVASGEEHLNLYRTELPGITCIPFSGFKPGYSRHLPQYIPLLLKSPLLVFHIVREHFLLKRVIKEYSIDIVISDNRFGLWNSDIRTAYVTHQPLIPFPGKFKFLEFIGVALHRFIIKKYSLCLIPDMPGEINLSGRLSHGMKLPGNVRYIGILSRFPAKNKPRSDRLTVSGYITVILSGPEPQKSIFRQKVSELSEHTKKIMVILEGRTGKEEGFKRSGNLISISHLATPEMERIIVSGDKIITRAGYSTIMELVSLGRSALLVPTPGQPEQEYLAEYLSSGGFFSYCTQKNLKEGFSFEKDNVQLPEKLIEESSTLLDLALTELLK